MRRRDFLTLLAGAVIAPVAVIEERYKPPTFVAGGIVDPAPDEHTAILHSGEAVINRAAVEQMEGADDVLRWILENRANPPVVLLPTIA